MSFCAESPTLDWFLDHRPACNPPAIDCGCIGREGVESVKIKLSFYGGGTGDGGWDQSTPCKNDRVGNLRKEVPRSILYNVRCSLLSSFSGARRLSALKPVRRSPS